MWPHSPSPSAARQRQDSPQQHPDRMPPPYLPDLPSVRASTRRHTVGVSAVRDLFGTMQNEGASKGILVTTSGYGKASYEFAEGKPIELLSGSNLLYLLAEHAGVQARIEMPDNWRDPQPDS